MKMNQKNKKNNNLRSVSLFMEKFWLVLAIASFVVVMYIFINDGGLNRQNAQYLVFPLLAGLMYGFRTYVRKRLEKNQD